MKEWWHYQGKNLDLYVSVLVPCAGMYHNNFSTNLSFLSRGNEIQWVNQLAKSYTHTQVSQQERSYVIVLNNSSHYYHLFSTGYMQGTDLGLTHSEARILICENNYLNSKETRHMVSKKYSGCQHFFSFFCFGTSEKLKSEASSTRKNQILCFYNLTGHFN